jgi:type IV pilus assembly protein PilF
LRRAAAAALTLAGLVLASGCAQQPVVGGGGGDATGNLGSPQAAASPADVYIDLSAAYLRENRLSDAMLNARKGVVVDPRSSNAQYMLALVQQALGQPQPAEQAYRRAIALDPRNPLALNAYGLFLCNQERMDEADPYFRRALENPLYPTPWLALHNAGWCHERAGRRDEAERDYRAALRQNPKFAPSLLGMARISAAAGNYLSARAYLQRYQEVAEHTAESLWIGVQAEHHLGDRKQKASYGLQLRAKFPDSDEAKHLQSIE